MKTPVILIKLTEVSSTNDYAARLINENKAADGVVVSAAHQTSGKGQEKNTWESSPGKNLTISIIIQPGIEAGEQFLLNMISSLAVRDFVKHHLPGSKISIKWPNDIYVDDRKIAGILINNTIVGNQISWTIMGVGININQEIFLSGAPNPVSMVQISGKHFDLEVCLDSFISRFSKWSTVLKSGDFAEIQSAYHQSLYKLNKKSDFLIKGKKTQATITGVAEFGYLQLQLADRTEILCDLKEIKYLL
jgi:BirA family transcriptional regulator, biotin operon repressor / biotin---[acetyl-CoA-carboxylase] ligase